MLKDLAASPVIVNLATVRTAPAYIFAVLPVVSAVVLSFITLAAPVVAAKMPKFMSVTLATVKGATTVAVAVAESELVAAQAPLAKAIAAQASASFIVLVFIARHFFNKSEMAQ